MKQWVIAVDLGGTKIVGGLMDENGQVTGRQEIPTQARDGASMVFGRLRSLVAGLQAAAPGPLLGVGVASPGIIDNGRVLYATPNLPGWSGLDLAGSLRAATGLPVWVDNDGHAAAWGERVYGAGQGVRNMVLVTVGTGIGGGIVAEGNLVRGAAGLAGRLGHVSIAPGPTCSCGNRGCVELFASGTAIAREANARLQAGTASALQPGPQLTAKEITEAAQAGDPLARELLRQAGEALGLLFVQVVELLNPQKIIVTGGVAAADSLLLAPAEAVVRRQARPEATHNLEILRAELGTDAGLVGIGDLARRNLGF